MINRNLLTPKLVKVLDAISAAPAEDVEYDASGWDSVYLLAAGANAKVFTVKTYGRLRVGINGQDDPGVWVLLATTVLTVANTNPADPEDPAKFTSALTAVPCQPYDKVKYVPSGITGPISLWAGGARTTTGE